MKKFLLGMTITSSIGLLGCDSQSLDEIANSITPSTVQTRWVFDPANGALPLPNDLLFNGTSDGTLHIPDESSGNYTDPSIALGALDGWSTISPISIEAQLPTSIGGSLLSLSSSSVAQAGAVRLFEATTSGPLSSDPTCITAESTDALVVCKLGAELAYGVDFVTQVSGNKLVIVPLKPLKASQSYLYATTSLIEDSEGRAVAASPTYTLLKLDIQTNPLATEEQLLLQKLVNSYENTLESSYSIDKDNVTYSGLFTTQSVGVVNKTLKSLMTLGAPYAPSFTSLPAAVDNGLGGTLTVAQAAGLSPADGLVYQLANATDMYSATLKIPYYGDCSSSACLDSSGAPLINGRWSAQGDNPIAVLGALSAGTLSSASFAQQAAAQGVDPTAALADPSLLAGKTWNLDNGQPVDTAKHITKLNPIPAIKRYEEIPVLITIPNQVAFAALNIPLTLPADGWPSVIALHGLGGGKEASLTFAGVYAQHGIATVSIDMPLHGERSFGLVGGRYTITATDDSFGEAIGQNDLYDNGNPLVFVNIASTLTTRDNFNQGIADHLALRLALSSFGASSSLLDGSKVSAQGLSLGAIVGSSFATIAQADLINPATGQLVTPNPYSINGLSLVAPAGGLAGSFAGSPTFKPLLIASDTFQEVLTAANVQNLVPNTPEYDALVELVLGEFIPGFAFAVQTAIDSIDPINYGLALNGLNLPTHLIEVTGDGSNLADQVLPNSVQGFPLSGTEPLIATIDLPCVDASNSPKQGSGVVRFSKGHHSSINSAGEITGVTDGSAAAATAEMQLQVAGYAQSAAVGSATVTVTNPAVVATCSN